jgi:hypothetical protein
MTALINSMRLIMIGLTAFAIARVAIPDRVEKWQTSMPNLQQQAAPTPSPAPSPPAANPNKL